VLVVDVDRSVGPEVDRIGAECPGAVVLIGVHDLHAQRLPSAGRAADQHARPSLSDAAEPLLDVRKQVVRDRVAVRPLFAEFTAYESSKYGVGCWTSTWMMRGKFGAFRSCRTGYESVSYNLYASGIGRSGRSNHSGRRRPSGPGADRVIASHSL